MLDRELFDVRDVIEIKRISDINLVMRTCDEYERIRYGNDNQISMDAAVDLVLRELGLED